METIKTAVRTDLNNPELEKIANQVLNIATLSVEKAIVHYSDPERYPISDDEESLEVIFLNNFKSLPERQRRRSVEKIRPRIDSEPIARAQEFGELSRVDFSSRQTMAQQAEALSPVERLRLSQEAITQLQAINTPLDGELQFNLGGMPEQLPKPEKLQFRLHEVYCVDETNGLLGNEWGGEDEILLGGMTVNAKEETKKIPSYKVYGYFDDGDKITYSPPKILAEFDIDSPDWPKKQLVALILTEEDHGNFPEWLDKFFNKVTDKLAEFVDDVYGDTGYIEKAAKWIFNKINDFIKELWEDNIFEPITLATSLTSLSARFDGGKSTSPRWSVDRKQFGGHYRLTYDWNIAWSQWKLIGGAASDIYISGDTVYATNPTTGDLYRHEAITGNWVKVGGPGSQFAATNDEIFGLAVDKTSVFRFTGNPGEWERVGGPSTSLIAGGNELYAISPQGGDIYKYEGRPGQWSKIGGPGRMFAASNHTLYGLSSDLSSIHAYDDANDNWTKIGGSGRRIFAGANELVATSPVNGHLYRYQGEPGQWEGIGSGGVQFTMTQQGVFGIAPQRKGTYKYSGEPNKWHEIGGAFETLCGGTTKLFGLAVDTKEVWMLE